jgi:DNA polymerase sigma
MMKIKVDMNPGNASGKTTLKSILSWLAESIRAASIMVLGITAINIDINSAAVGT